MLDHCSSCQTTEGGWREPTLAEAQEHGFTQEDIENEELETRVCCECGEVGSLVGIPEHDDSDMER